MDARCKAANRITFLHTMTVSNGFFDSDFVWISSSVIIDCVAWGGMFEKFFARTCKNFKFVIVKTEYETKRSNSCFYRLRTWKKNRKVATKLSFNGNQQHVTGTMLLHAVKIWRKLKQFYRWTLVLILKYAVWRNYVW